MCKSCNKEWGREYYIKHKKEVRVREKLRREKVREFVESKRLACSSCGETDVVCLDFHHRNPKAKECGIGLAIRKGWSVARVAREIAKCDVLCANCHRKAHRSKMVTVAQ